MNTKQILMPDWKKVLLTVILIGVSFLYKAEPIVLDAYIIDHGFPLAYLEGLQGAKTGQIDTLHYSMQPLGLIVDLIFWYLISSIVVSILIKQKKKK